MYVLVLPIGDRSVFQLAFKALPDKNTDAMVIVKATLSHELSVYSMHIHIHLQRSCSSSSSSSNSNSSSHRCRRLVVVQDFIDDRE
ncbi:hypothetical protein M0802_013568 [Mischocyttarus mexicanus]|nr:hypothetical protein M0802_013568 [Mischocyttarus mexicanus]